MSCSSEYLPYDTYMGWSDSDIVGREWMVVCGSGSSRMQEWA